MSLMGLGCCLACNLIFYFILRLATKKMNWLQEFPNQIGGHIVCQNEPRGLPLWPTSHSCQPDWSVPGSGLTSLLVLLISPLHCLFPWIPSLLTSTPECPELQWWRQGKTERGTGSDGHKLGFLPGDNAPVLAQWTYFHQVKSSKDLSNTSQLLELGSWCSSVVMSALSMWQPKYFVKPENSLRH